MTAIELPDGPSTPRLLQGLQLLSDRTRSMRHLRERYGSAFTLDLPMFGRALVLTDPAEVKEAFLADAELIEFEGTLGSMLGPGSMFSLTGQRHRRERKLLAPPFHGRRLKVYEAMIEEEAVREMATWPEGRPFATMGSMMRITLNAILRAVFGAEGEEFEALRRTIPPLVTLGSRLTSLPVPKRLGPYGPWARYRRHRRDYDAIVGRLIDRTLADPDLERRDDVLAMMLQARYEDGSAMSRGDVADELLTLLSAGHETTATTLAWAVERLQRHPEALDALVADLDAGGTDRLEATVTEVQRIRPVIEIAPRRVLADTVTLGRWTVPRGMAVLIAIRLVHENEELYTDALAFDPGRFLGSRPDPQGWIPFGGGVRRCVGAAFATMELHVVLRTLLRDFALEPTDGPGERTHFRGVAVAPAKGGRVVLRRRREVGRRETAEAGSERV